MTPQKNFDELLIAFFNKYDKRQIRNVYKIAEKFGRSPDIVMGYLCIKYNVDPKSIEGIELSPSTMEQVKVDREIAAEMTEDNKPVPEATTGEETTDVAEDTEAAKPSAEGGKSKKKLILIIIIVVVIGAAGAAGYLFKDKIFGGGSGEAEPTEEVSPAEEATPEPEVKAEEPPVIETDTTKEASDSAEVNTGETEETGEATE